MDTVETLYRDDFGRADLVRRGAWGQRGRIGCEGRFQIVAPFNGCFVWHTPHEDLFVDTNRILFASGEEPHWVSNPIGDDCSLVLTLDALALADALGLADMESLLFRRWRTPSFAMQLQVRLAHANWLHCGANSISLRALVLQLLEGVRERPMEASSAGAGSLRTLIRAKAYLHQATWQRKRLKDVADAVGVSPTYITRLFTALEGMPLHQYVTRLRLAAVLDALAESDDLTHLALDLGFSSHSHLTVAFRSHYGSPPSAVRSLLRPPAHPRAFERRHVHAPTRTAQT